MEKSRKSVRLVPGKPGDHVTNLAPEEKEKLVRRRNDELSGKWAAVDTDDARFTELFTSKDFSLVVDDS